MPLAKSADHSGGFGEGVFGKGTLDLTVRHPFSSKDIHECDRVANEILRTNKIERE